VILFYFMCSKLKLNCYFAIVDSDTVGLDSGDYGINNSFISLKTQQVFYVRYDDRITPISCV